MNAIWTLAKKELKDLFGSPVAYVFVCITLFASFWLFFAQVFVVGQTSLRALFDWLPVLFTIFLPSVTMGAWSGEKKSGTLEILLTLPVSETALVLGKFLASLFFLGFLLVLTLPLPVVFAYLGDLDFGVVITSYAGSLLLGATYLAIGLWLSSLVKQQVLAYVLTVSVLLFFFVLGQPLIQAYVPTHLTSLLDYLCLGTHFESLEKGVLDSRDLIFFSSLLVLFLYLNVRGLKQGRTNTTNKRYAAKLSAPLFSLFLLIILSGLNTLSSQYPVRVDLTQEQEFTLSATTRERLHHLEDQLTIKFYCTQNLPAALTSLHNSIIDLLKEMKAQAKQPIVINTINPQLNELTEQEALELGMVPLELNIKEKDKVELKKVYLGLALYYRDRRESIPVAAQIPTLEYKLNLALLKLTQDKSPRVGLLIGQDKNQYSFLDRFISEIGTPVEIDPQTTNLAAYDLDSFLLVAPDHLDKKILSQIDALIDSGLSVAIFSGNTSVNDNLQASIIATGLDDWLEDKGLMISQKLLVDILQNEQALFQQGALQVYRDYPFWIKTMRADVNPEHPITNSIEEILFPWTNALLIAPQDNPKWEIDELVRSSTNSFLQPEETTNVAPDYVQTMTQQPTLANYPLSVSLTNKTNPHAGKIYVTSTHNLIQDIFLEQAHANVLFLSNMLEHATWGNKLISLRTRGKTTRPLKELSPQTLLSIKWGHLAGIPLLAILFGLMVNKLWSVKRNSSIKQISVKGSQSDTLSPK